MISLHHFSIVGSSNELIFDEKLKFYYITIDEYFDSTAAFSQLTLSYNNGAKEITYITGREIFTLDVLYGTDKDKNFECKLLKRFDDVYCKLKPSELKQSKEAEFFISAVKVLFSKLCNEVVLNEGSYTTKVAKDKDINVKVVSTGRIGISSYNTWHGYPDARIRVSKYSSVDVINYGQYHQVMLFCWKPKSTRLTVVNSYLYYFLFH